MARFDDLKVGEVLSETQFYTVDKVKGDKVQLAADNGEKVVVTREYAESFLASSAQHMEVKKVTRTELTEVVLNSPRLAMTVNFNKKVDVKDIKRALHSLYPNKGGKIASEAAFKKNVNAAIDLKGEERTMIGRHYGHVDSTGRLSFIDMKAVKKVDSDYDTRQRLVDPRTLNWAIINNVKWEVKK